MRIIRRLREVAKGRFSKGKNNEFTYMDSMKQHSPYIKKLILLGERYEKSGGAPDELGHLITWAVNGMSANP